MELQGRRITNLTRDVIYSLLTVTWIALGRTIDYCNKHHPRASCHFSKYVFQPVCTGTSTVVDSVRRAHHSLRPRVRRALGYSVWPQLGRPRRRRALTMTAAEVPKRFTTRFWSSTNVTLSQSQAHLLTRLPAEVRMMIWEEVLRYEDFSIVCRHRNGLLFSQRSLCNERPGLSRGRHAHQRRSDFSASALALPLTCRAV